MVLPDKLFIQALALQDLRQDENILRPCVDPHKLKQISEMWWKGDQLVITADVPQRQAIVQMHHNMPAYRHPEPYNLPGRGTGGPVCHRTSQTMSKGAQTVKGTK